VTNWYVLNLTPKSFTIGLPAIAQSLVQMSRRWIPFSVANI